MPSSEKEEVGPKPYKLYRQKQFCKKQKQLCFEFVKIRRLNIRDFKNGPFCPSFSVFIYRRKIEFMIFQQDCCVSFLLSLNRLD